MSKRHVALAVGLAGLLISAAGCSGATTTSPSSNPSANPLTMTQHHMQITSPAFGTNQSIPAKYTCDGDNTSPPLEFQDVPTGTVSLVLIMEDPDVPKTSRPDGMWDHWVVFDIPPQTTQVAESQNPPGILGVNTRGLMAYGSPCPPDREHRYFFKLFALDNRLNLPAGSTKADVLSAMAGHIIDQAELIGLYDRSR